MVYSPYRGRPNFVSHSLKVPSLVRGRTDLDAATHAKVHGLVHLVRPAKGSAVRALLPPGSCTADGDAERELLLAADPALEPGAEALLRAVFQSRCAFGDRLNTTQLSEAKWARLLRDAGDAAGRPLVPLAADAAVVFKKVGQALGQAPRLRFSGFLKALQLCALRDRLHRSSTGLAGGLAWPEDVLAALKPLAEALPAADADPVPGAAEDPAVQDYLDTQGDVVRQLFCYFSHQPLSSAEARPSTPRAVPRADLSGELKPGGASSPGSSKTSTKVSAGGGARARTPSRGASFRGLGLADFQALVRATAPDLVPPAKARAVFAASAGGADARLSAPDFGSALARLAVLAYGQSPYEELYPDPAAKVQAFFTRALQVGTRGPPGCLRGRARFAPRPASPMRSPRRSASPARSAYTEAQSPLL